MDLSTNQILNTVNMNNDVLTAKIEEFMEKAVCQNCREIIDKQEIKDQPVKPYTLGQSIFTLHHQTDLISVVANNGSGRYVSDIVMMDDGRLVMCLSNQYRILICNIDGSQVDSINVQGCPWCVTAVNNSTVTVILYYSECIEMYDINNKLKLKSISVPRMWWGSGITTINNKLVVRGTDSLLIIDHQTGNVVETIKTDCHPYSLRGSGDRLFYYDFYNNKLYWYSNTDTIHHTLTLTSPPESMTTLKDGSLCVICEDGSVQHV